MYKEVLIAIVLGSILGLGVAFGVWRANNAIKNQGAAKTEVSDNGASSGKAKEGGLDKLELVITEPANRQVAVNTPTVVNGISSRAQYVAITGEKEDVILMPEEDGTFQAMVELAGGVNEIGVFAFDEKDTVSETLLVLYSTQVLEEEKEVGTIQKPVAVLGTVTDITENAVQIRSTEGEIKQITVSDETSYANIVKETKEVTFEDMAIGDFIVAMGYVRNGNEILEAIRVLITVPIEASGRRAVRGKVSAITSKEIGVNSGGETVEASTSGKVFVTKQSVDEDGEVNIGVGRLGEIKEGDEIILVVVPDGDELTARTIHVVATN